MYVNLYIYTIYISYSKFIFCNTLNKSIHVFSEFIFKSVAKYKNNILYIGVAGFNYGNNKAV